MKIVISDDALFRSLLKYALLHLSLGTASSEGRYFVLRCDPYYDIRKVLFLDLPTVVDKGFTPVGSLKRKQPKRKDIFLKQGKNFKRPRSQRSSIALLRQERRTTKLQRSRLSRRNGSR
jgi:hypothetical protein